jgi:hypothetical protein
MNSAPALKFCPCCYLLKDDFSPDRRNKDGLNYRCKACHSASFRQKYAVNPIPSRLAVKKYRNSLRDHST